MMNKLKNWIRASIPAQLKQFVAYSADIEFGTLSFSQFGEDIMLQNLLSETQQGFYVDVGAHHPIRCSNTYLFYKKGWQGINIDPLPGTAALFRKFRPRDISIEMGVSDKEEELIYYVFREPLENTFIKERAEKINSSLNPLKEKIKIKVMRLEDILDQNLPQGTAIDLLSVDAEGFDLNVLRSNNWKKYAPRIVLVEDFNFKFNDESKSAIYNFLGEAGYAMEAVSGNSLIFKKVNAVR